MPKNYYAHGKLLLTAEYVVLDGAKALAIPTKFGQKMTVKEIGDPVIKWSSFLADGSLWFSQEFVFTEEKIGYQLEEKNNTNEEVVKNLAEILQEVATLSFHLDFQQGYEINSFLEFPRNWGLGSSSTLIQNLSQWAQINPYQLLEKTFGGSGYDIACAEFDTPIIYERNKLDPKIAPVNFQPNFSDQLFFVYLNQKKNSREAIRHYRSLEAIKKASSIAEINQITTSLLKPNLSLSEFETQINRHEEVLSKVLQTPSIKKQLFSDYKDSIKSLGGWGGDFVLATGTQEMMSYFKDLGYTTVIPFSEMIFSSKRKY
ncbi:GYDIA family GHMP kinase [Mesonia sp. MT50]|uniref:GYDIA family GHMP kinase n=1 Tax=Mesonia profundi TaxID=3070998 RepID=A0ABU0ZXL2_9FLAO|nr:GYDIA family GHMP kinase [Mesonia profundi]MDQ7916202.1 GYDIA family GHMP kinase [Mesonia profundi]